MKRTFDVVVEQGQSGWLVATVPTLRGCVTQGRDLKNLERNVVEAIELYLEEPPAPNPEVTFVGIHRVEGSA